MVSACTPIDFGQDVEAQVTRMEQVVKQERQLQELVLVHGLKFQEISDIHGIGPQNLAKAVIRVIVR